MGRQGPPEAPYTPSTAPADIKLVQLGPPLGSGNFTCTDAEGVERTVEMPAKIKRVAYAARGMFVFVRLSNDSPRVQGEITHVVQAHEVRAWRKDGEWPKAFDVTPAPAPAATEDDDDLPENPNRRGRVVESSSEEEDSDEEED